MKKLATLNKMNELIVIKKLTDDESNTLTSILEYIDRFDLIYNSKNYFTENYQTFNQHLMNMEAGNIPTLFMKYGISVVVQNLLSSIRGYIDTFAHTLSQEFGKESKEFTLFRECKSKAFDSNKSYRVVEVARNYSQHVGVPISNIEISLSEDGRKVKLLLDREELIRGSKISKKKGEDIRDSFPKVLDIAEHLKVMVGLLLGIHDKMLSLIIDYSRIDNYLNYKSYLPDEEHSLVIIDNLEPRENITFNIKAFEFDRISYLVDEYKTLISTLYPSQTSGENFS